MGRVFLTLFVAFFMCATMTIAVSVEDYVYPENKDLSIPSVEEFVRELENNGVFVKMCDDPVYYFTETVLFKNVNKTFSKHGVSFRISEEKSIHPNRQMYVIGIGCAINEKLYSREFVYDAETKDPISRSTGISNLIEEND